MSYRAPDPDDILGEEWDEFANELATETVQEVAGGKGFFRVIFLLFGLAIIAGAVFVFLTQPPADETTNDEDDTNGTTAPNNDANGANLPLVDASKVWLSNAANTAEAYHAQLSGEMLDCVAFRDEMIYRVPPLPNFGTATAEEQTALGAAISSMTEAYSKLEETERRLEIICPAEQTTRPRAEWEAVSPISQVEAAQTFIEQANTTLE